MYCPNCKTKEAYKVRILHSGREIYHICDRCPVLRPKVIEFPAIHKSASASAIIPESLIPVDPTGLKALPKPEAVPVRQSKDKDTPYKRMLDDVTRVKQGKRCDLNVFTHGSQGFPDKRLHTMIVKQLKTSNYKIIHNKGGRVIADVND